MQKRKWFIEVLLVVVIISMVVLIVYLINRGVLGNQKSTQENQSDNAAQITATTEIPDKIISQASEITADPGNKAPEFELMNVEGELISLSDFQGRVVIINFWATWCPPCRAEMPLFEEAARKYKDALIVFAVNSGEEVDVIRDFSSRFGQDIIFLMDQDYAVGELYRVRGLPTTFFVDSEGSLQAMHIGQLDESILNSYLEKMGIQ